MQGSLDEMVQLLQSDSVPPPVHDIFGPGLRRITYATIEEIPSRLAQLPSEHLSFSQMPSPDDSDLSSGISPVPGVNADLEEGNAKDVHIDANEASEILSNQEECPDFIPRMELPEIISARHLEDEKHAATIIQRAYRMVLEQRRLRNQTVPELFFEGQNRHYFHLCWKRVREENRKSDKWTLAFLGPLPHLLSSLDSAEFLTMAKKFDMKKLLVNESVKLEALDEVSSVLNRIRYALDLIS
jgi:hypothetical protein